MHDPKTCKHDFVLMTTGGLRFTAGEVDDDLRDEVICRLCGQPQPEPQPVEYDEPATF